MNQDRRSSGDFMGQSQVIYCQKICDRDR